MVHADLKLFLETNLPLSGKKKAVLGVSDAKIGAALQEEFTISIQTGGVVAEIGRGEMFVPDFILSLGRACTLLKEGGSRIINAKFENASILAMMWSVVM